MYEDYKNCTEIVNTTLSTMKKVGLNYWNIPKDKDVIEIEDTFNISFSENDKGDGFVANVSIANSTKDGKILLELYCVFWNKKKYICSTNTMNEEEFKKYLDSFLSMITELGIEGFIMALNYYASKLKFIEPDRIFKYD